MQVTELLITGFDGDEAVFAVNLAADTAAIGSTSTDKNGETVVDEVREQRDQAADTLQAVLQILERLKKIPATTPS